MPPALICPREKVENWTRGVRHCPSCAVFGGPRGESVMGHREGGTRFYQVFAAWAELNYLPTTTPSILRKAWGHGGSEPLSDTAGGMQLGMVTWTLVPSRPKTSLWRGVPCSAQAHPLTRPSMCLGNVSGAWAGRPGGSFIFRAAWAPPRLSRRPHQLELESGPPASGTLGPASPCFDLALKKYSQRLFSPLRQQVCQEQAENPQVSSVFKQLLVSFLIWKAQGAGVSCMLA